MPRIKKPKGLCLVCAKETARAGYKYCSNVCQQAFQYNSYIERWKKGEEIGLIKLGVVSGSVKRYLRNKFENKCCICGWAETNTKTGLIPLVADHIDGNWRNNVESNLRLICPNCDSLTHTYAALNRGRGRENRAQSKRSIDAHLFVQ